MNASPHIERIARHVTAEIIAVPGWANDLDGVCDAVIKMIFRAVPDAATARILAQRTVAILTELGTANDDELCRLLIDEYPDLLPPDLRAAMNAKAIEVLKDAGAAVETFKDDEGTTFLKLANVEALGIPNEEMDRLQAAAPVPVGKLHRVQ